MRASACFTSLHYQSSEKSKENKPQQTKRPDSQNQQQTKGCCVGFFAFKLKQNHASFFHCVLFNLKQRKQHNKRPKDRKVIPDPIDDREFQELKESGKDGINLTYNQGQR